MIELYKFGAQDTLPDPSPFCVKVETYLRMTKTPYESHSGMAYLKKSPKNKLPYIKENGEIIADSSFIFRHLEQKSETPLNGHLSDEQKAIAHSMCKMIDENLYWTVVYARWILDHNWVILKEMLLGSIPFPLNIFVPNLIRKGVLKSMKGHGIGRHSAAEIAEIGAWDLQALSDFLGDKPYFFGEQPSTLDAAAFGVLSQMILTDRFSAPVFDRARDMKNLVDFTHRIKDQYFQDFQE